jgi:hypothetical protein
MTGTASSAELRTKYPITQGLVAKTTSQLKHDTKLEAEREDFTDVKHEPLSSQGINNGG